jgi:D-amino-acid dehydrogenase
MRIAVVGAGIAGASCAYAAARRGADTVLIDARLDGRATDAGAGIICPWTAAEPDPAWYEFGCAAAARYPQLLAELAAAGEADVGYRQAGALRLTGPGEDPGELARQVRARAAQFPQAGEITVLDAGAARAAFPPLRPDAAGVRIGGAARLDGRRLAAALRRAAARAGATVRTGRAELAFRGGQEGGGRDGPAGSPGTAGGPGPDPRPIRGVRVDGELVAADAVVAAAGAWTGRLLAPAGIRVAVTPQRGQIVHLSVAPAPTSDWPVVLPGRSGHYLLAFDDSRVVAGATRETGAGFDYRVTTAGLAEVLAQALAVAPGLAGATWLETRVGFRPAGPDPRPLLGPVAGTGERLVIATGLGATGLTMGPYAGQIAASLALGEPAGLDLAPFDPLRPPPAAASA